MRRIGASTLIAGLCFGVAACGGSRLADGLRPQMHLRDVVLHVQHSFGDRGIISASVSGQLLTVKVVAPDEPSAVRATFEAQILASAFHDVVSARGQTPINSVQYEDASGKPIPGYGQAPVGTDTSGHPLPKIATLAKGACRSAAQRIQRPTLVIESALTLPYAGGACAFKFRASDPSSFNAPIDVGKLVNAMGDPNDRSYLVEVDDRAGVPQFVHDFTPGGGGVAYVKPGSGILFGP